MKKKIVLVLVPFLISLISCGGESKKYFKSWNDCKSLTTLKEYVKDVTDKKSKNYIPVEDRIATFDMDGTFIGELYPTYFEYNMLEYRALEDPTYKQYAPDDVKEVAREIRDFVRNGTKLPDHFDMRHAYAAAKAYSGMTVGEFDSYVKEYAKNTPNGFTGMTYAESFYQPMLEVFDYLKDNDFTYYVVSGSDRFICRALVDSIGIDSNRVIGMDVVLKSSEQEYKDGVDYTMGVDEDLIRTDELIIKNLKTNKVKQIAQEIGKVPVLSFGNSSGDSAMHNYCMGNKKYKSEAFMLIADDEDEDHVDLKETAKRKAAWEEAHYNIISMKDDFKTIYGTNVKKVDFNFDADFEKEATFAEFNTIANNVDPHKYETAEIDINRVDAKIYDDPKEEPSYTYTHTTLDATYDVDNDEWVLESDDPTVAIYGFILNTTAKKVVENQNVTSEMFDGNRDTHYYTGTGFRYRYRASGTMETSLLTVSQSAVGALMFDEFGLLTYSNEINETVVKGYGATNHTEETIFVAYK